MVTRLKVTLEALEVFTTLLQPRQWVAEVAGLPHLVLAVMAGQIARALLPVMPGWPPLKGTVAGVVAGLKVLRQVVTVARVSRVFA